MKIYFLRHCESEFNANPLNDQINCSLTEQGIEQSLHIFDHFEKGINEFDLIISSPLRRCLETIKYSMIKDFPVEINYLFREIRQGSLCDLLNEKEEIRYETEKDIERRIGKIHEFLLEKKSKNVQSMLIVGHADLFFQLTSYQYEGETFGKWFRNGEILLWKIF